MRKPTVLLVATLSTLAFLLALAGSRWVAGRLPTVLERLDVEPAARWRWLSLGGLGAFYLLMIPLTLLATAALVGAARTPSLLGLARPRLGTRRLATWSLAGLFTVYVGVLLRGALFGPPSSRLQAFDQLLGSEAGGALLTAALVSVMALGGGLGEELLFRGLLLRGLAGRLAPAALIPVVALVFAIAHADLQHAVALVPFSLWLTILAWRSGTLWPAVLGHLLNNAVVGALVAFGAAGADHMDAWVHALAWGLAFPAFLLALFDLRVDRRRP